MLTLILALLSVVIAAICVCAFCGIYITAFCIGLVKAFNYTKSYITTPSLAT